MLRRRTLLAASGAVLLAGCATVDSGAADLQRRFGDVKGVESVNITTETSDEAILYKVWSATVVFTSESTAAQVGTLIGMFFTYAKNAGLSADRMKSVEFTAKNGCVLSLTNAWLDDAQSAEAGAAMFAVPNSRMYASIGGGRSVLHITSKVLRDSAKDLTRSAAMIAAGPAFDLFDVEYTITDDGSSDTFTVYADHRIGTAEVAFAGICQRWILTHATTGCILAFSTATNARIVLSTDTEIPDAVRELAAARGTTVTCPVVAYVHGSGTPYVTIP